MAQKRIKRTDQEWFDLIKDCKTSSLKVKIWCEQHGITEKVIDYHTRRGVSARKAIRSREKSHRLSPMKNRKLFDVLKPLMKCWSIRWREWQGRSGL